MKIYNVANKDETAFYSSGYNTRYEAEMLLKISITHDPDAHVVEYEAMTEYEALKAERDAAVSDMTKIVQKSGESYCEYCRNWERNTCPPYCRTHSEGFRWRGIQKEE